jgi:hypothetical protein
MGWKTALPAETIAAMEAAKPVKQKFQRPVVPMHKPDLKRIVTVDFETYYDSHFTLRKLSTSEYIRHDMFRVQMVGIKIGKGKTRVLRPEKAQEVLDSIDWGSTALLCHNTQFDGFILSHHYGIVPTYYYDTLSMARGLHSNEVGASLNDVAQYYGRGSKLDGVLETTKGVFDWDNALFKAVTPYCAQDVDLTFDIFCDMVKKYPADEMDLIDMTVRMFCDPVLLVDTDRVGAEYHREVSARTQKFYAAVNPLDYEPGGKLHDPAVYKKLLKTPAERELPDDERRMLVIQRVIGSNELFSDLLRAEGVEPPTKQSAAWLKKDPADRDENDEYGYAFSKTDLEFINLPDAIDAWRGKLDPNKPRDMAKILARQDRIRTLVECRLSVKSTSNITRSERFLEAGKDGMCLPAGYAYYRAHTGRWGGNNKMNMQNLARGGELRLSILAQPGHRLCVVDSGQIEARVNGWLWGQDDLLDDFRRADKWDKATMGVARGDDRDAYCKFGDIVYTGKEVTTNDKMERFVGKVCVLGLGYQMGAPKFQLTLARGALGGPPVHFDENECHRIVNAYRSKNYKIKEGWDKCTDIIKDMAVGKQGAWKCLNWEKETIWLPNGMCLKFPDLKSQVTEDGFVEYSYQSGDSRSKLYGGKLCENLVQALARIIVATQMLWMQRDGLRVVMTTHDEAVCMVPAKQADAAFALMLKHMTTPLNWCPDIPLAAEGGHDINYSK